MRSKVVYVVLVVAIFAVVVAYYSLSSSSSHLVKLQDYLYKTSQKQTQQEQQQQGQRQAQQYLQIQNQKLEKDNQGLLSKNTLLQAEIQKLNQRVSKLESDQKRKDIEDIRKTMFNAPEKKAGDDSNKNKDEAKPAESAKQKKPNSSDVKLHPGVKVVQSKLPPDVVLKKADCVHLPSAPKSGVKICLHPSKEDVHVSGTIKRGGLWEHGLIMQMNNLLKKDPNLQLVDLGCNIGEYTLWAAAMGRPVLAVEMLDSNVHLVQKSLQLSNLGSLVTLVQNAVYSDRRDLKTLFLQSNIGGTRLNTSSHNDPAGRVDSGKASVTVHTILLDDLVPLVDKSRPIYMKIDVENSEHQVLKGAHTFFQELDIRYVQMEWLARTPEEISGIRAFMTKYGYVPHRSASNPEVADIGQHTIQGDVIFIKEGKKKEGT